MMQAVYKNNEATTNEVCVKAVKLFIVFVLVVAGFGWLGIFDVASYLVNILVVTVIVPLMIPVILIDFLHIESSWVKYIILSCMVMAVVIAYVIFTFQSVILFVIPSILGAMYLDKKVTVFTATIMSIGIFVAHIITGFILFQPWIEPFTDKRAILMYGAVPRTLQYLCCVGLLHIMSERFINFLQGFNYALTEVTNLSQEKDKGTIKDKNYVSLIYDKLEIRNRTALVVKYSPFEETYD